MKPVTFLEKNGTCKIGGSRNDGADDTSILGSEAVSVGEKLPTFEKNIMPSSSESGVPRKICVLFFFLKMTALEPIEISETSFSTTQRHAPEDL
jgi:hypothetical protein